MAQVRRVARHVSLQVVAGSLHTAQPPSASLLRLTPSPREMRSEQNKKVLLGS